MARHVVLAATTMGGRRVERSVGLLRPNVVQRPQRLTGGLGL